MHQLEQEPNGTYRFSPTAMLFSVSRRVLDGAVPEVISTAAFGWLRGGLPAPDENGAYIVEFVDRACVRVLAYIDHGARVFKTSQAQADDFDDQPILQLARYAQQKDDGVQRGCVEVRDANAKMRVVAHYESIDGRFWLRDSWFDFGENGEDLSYNDVLARCYLAFVHRCDLGGPRILDCGLDGIEKALRSAVLPRVVHQIVSHVRRGSEAAGFNPPALARHLARWLEDAHGDRLSEGSDALNLVRSARYSDLFFVVPVAGKRPRVPANVIGAIEGALDTYKLVKDRLGERAASASMAEVAKLAREVMVIAPAKVACRAERLPYASKSEAASDFDLPIYDASLGEWSWRKALSTAIETIESPYRVVAEFRGDVHTGEAAMIGLSPAPEAMPKSYWDDARGLWTSYSRQERERQALDFALNSAVACIAAAFAGSELIEHVEFLGGRLDGPATVDSVFDDDIADDEIESRAAFWRSESDDDDRGRVLLNSICRVSVSRDLFCQEANGFGRADDVRALWAALGGKIIIDDVPHDMADGWPDALDLLERQNEAWRRSHRGDYPEIADGALPASIADALGAHHVRDMRITFGSRRRRNAETLADRLVEAQSDVESIRIARAMQDRASDPFDNDALTRVMSSLLAGKLDATDQNAIVNCYLGEDEYLKVLARARPLFQTDRPQAISLLLGVIDEAERSGRYHDGLEVVYRGFDTYASRLVYNLMRSGDLKPASELFDFGRRDAGKRVELIPDSLYLCYSSAAYFVEQTFDGFDQGVRLARKTIELAPTVVNGYRQLARAYTLVGDMAAACEILRAALEICVTPVDTAIVYYQLGYVYWKKGEPRLGAICYLKSMTVSPVVAAQAGVELHELMREEDLPVVGRPEIDEGLMRAGIPLAPLSSVLDAVMNGAAAAIDAGMFSTARDLLTAGLHYRPDDALVNVLRSLGSE